MTHGKHKAIAQALRSLSSREWAFLLIALLFCPLCAFAGECVEVTPAPSWVPSSPNIQLTVLWEGKPVKDGEIEVSKAQGLVFFSAKTDSDGKVNLSNLAPGRYQIAAFRPDTPSTFLLYLEVSKSEESKPTLFSVNLLPYPPPFKNIETQLAKAEKAPIAVRRKAFSGMVVDPSGAGVFNARIALYRRGSRDMLSDVKVAVDQQGRFSAQLAPGAYTAAFFSSGFRVETVSFEIAPDGSTEDLRVTLTVDACFNISPALRNLEYQNA
jgi:hypothetical protein